MLPLITSPPPVLWTELSSTQKVQGIHPTKLGVIEFNFSESKLPVEQLKRFFLGCRMATTDSDYLSKLFQLLNSDEQLLQPIGKIAKRVLFAQMPTERELKKDGDGRYNISISGKDSGRVLRDYIAKFAGVYNQLFAENKCYLMHLARRSELIEYLGTTFSDTERAADRLITYRCFGDYALEISELECDIQRFTDELEQVQAKLSTLLESGPKLITNPEALHEDALTCISDSYCRKYICLAYKLLASQGKLKILDLPENELYDLPGSIDGTAHSDLSSLVRAYYGGMILPEHNFRAVVKYLKTLRNSDLNDLMKFYLNEEVTRITWFIDYIKDDLLVNAKANSKNQLSQLTKQSDSYKPGDFSFLDDPETVLLLTCAYNAVEELNEWPFFDIEPPEGAIWRHPATYKVDREISVELAFTMPWMQRIRNKGWSVVVRESLEKNTEMLGILNRAWALATNL